MTEKAKIRAIVQLYKDKTEKCYKESCGEFGDDAPGSCYWGGFSDCAARILEKINSMQEEPVSNDLKIASEAYMNDKIVGDADYIDEEGNYYYYATALDYAFTAGANWQREQMINVAEKWLSDFQDHHSIREFHTGETPTKDEIRKSFIMATK